MGTPSFVIGSVGLVVATAGMVAARSSGGCRRAARVLLALPSAVVLLGLLGACNDTGGTAGAAAPVAVMTAASAPVPTASGTPTSTAAAGTGVVAAVPPAVTGPASSPAGSAASAADVLPVPARTTIRAQVPPAPVRTTVQAAAPVPLRTTVPAAASGRCDPSYPDVCLRTGIGDYDCAGGSGNGPNYVQGPVRVLRPDPFGLDADGDGTGCQKGK